MGNEVLPKWNTVDYNSESPRGPKMVGEPENLLSARSIAERHFYLMVLQCDKCGKGSFELVSTEQTPEQHVDVWYVRCKQCRQGQRLFFDRSALAVDEAAIAAGTLPEVNPTTQPSRLIDVGQWLALFYKILSAASAEKGRKEAQRLGYEATLCLEEALKFYLPDSDLPPPEALWVESSRQALKKRPDLFARQELLQRREKLPSLHVMRQAMTDQPPAQPNHNGHPEGNGKKHWWNKWFKKKTE
jgi:hypothetical protein